MFLNYWMIATFLVLVTYFLIRMYSKGYDEGFRDSSLINVDATLTILKQRKIINIIDDEGVTRITPGDYDEFIKASEEAKS